MDKFRHSLVLRIALPFALLMVLVMSGLSIYLSSYIQKSYLEILQENLQSETRLVADQMAAEIQTGQAGNLIDERAKHYANLLSVRVTIIDPNGKVLGETETAPEEMENHLNRPEVQRALQNQESAEIRYSRTLQTNMLYAAAPIIKNGQTIGVARLSVSLRAIRRTESSLQNTILVATGVATALTILLGILVAAVTISPLMQLTETAQQVADGKIEEIASTSRRDEIGQLHHSIQWMAHRLKAQIADLQIERSKLEAVLDNMTDAVIIVDGEGTVKLINPAALHLFSTDLEQALHKSVVEVVRSHQLVEIWRKSRLSGKQETTTLETAPDRLFVQGIATPLPYALPDMTMLVFQNLTRVRKLETVRRDFVSNVSHELRTPLASLKALTETLEEGALEDPPAARRFLQRMNTEIDNLTQMVHELLELSKIESNKVPLHRILVQPCELAAPAVERMQLQAERGGLRLSIDCPGSLPLVKADPERIEQVLVNLIHNAIKATRPGGEISVSAAYQDKQVVFSIRDTGAGIPPDVLPRIFERFYKVDRARSGGGTGLGSVDCPAYYRSPWRTDLGRKHC